MTEAQPARVVLVTGASSGFGLAIARELHAAGCRVYGTSRKAEGGFNPHGGFTLIAMDVDDDASVEAGVRHVVEREGRLDIVVSNAGMGIAGAIEDTATEEAKAQFETNFFGNHRVCRAALPHLRRRERAHIVVIGSLAGLFGIPFQGFYSATKFALEGYCEALRIELRQTGVQVAIVEPGDFATGFTAARRTVAARGPGSAYRAAFERALEVIEADETGGADPADLAAAVRKIIETLAPALRHPVGADDQLVLAQAKASVPAETFEGWIAAHFEG
jgi:NAD(P)-dependent dehydrogenase (short-subunit alcohol dehydrogenase family)